MFVSSPNPIGTERFQGKGEFYKSCEALLKDSKSRSGRPSRNTATEEDHQVSRRSPKRSTRWRRSKPEGKKKQRASDARKVLSLPPSRSLPLPFRPITDTARFGSCLRQCARAHVFTLSRGDENGGRIRRRRRRVDANVNVLQIRLPVRLRGRPWPLILGVHCAPSLTLRSLELAPCCAPERLSASCCRSSSSSSSASSSSSSPKSYRRSTLSAMPGQVLQRCHTALSSLPLKGRKERTNGSVATGF